MPHILYSQCQFPKNQNNRFVCPICKKELMYYDNINTLKKGGRKRFKSNEKFCYLRCPENIDHCNLIDIIKEEADKLGYVPTYMKDNRLICKDCFSPLELCYDIYLRCPTCRENRGQAPITERKYYEQYQSIDDKIAHSYIESHLMEDE